MAETTDLDEWELLSQNSSSREEFDEDDFSFLDHLSEKSDKKGEVFHLQETSQFNSNEISGTSVREIPDCSEGKMVNSEEIYLNLEMGFSEKETNFDKERPIGELGVCDNLDMENSVEELGFGESEVLDAFCSNGINYMKNRLKVDGIDNLNSSCSHDNEIHSEIKDFMEKDCVFGPNYDSSNLGNNFEEEETGFEKPVNSEGMVSSDILGIEENKEDRGFKNEICKGEKEKKGLIWWKMPIDVIKYYLFGIKPIWSVSLAMGLLGFLMISHKLYLYKMNKQQDKKIPPMKIHFDEKKRAQIQARAARLNKALTMVRPEPIIRTPFPGSGMTLFPAMSSFQWAP